jgi:hypothetical protein
MNKNRRYKVVNGKLEKRWDAPEGWHVTKADAWAEVAPKKVSPKKVSPKHADR